MRRSRVKNHHSRALALQNNSAIYGGEKEIKDIRALALPSNLIN